MYAISSFGVLVCRSQPLFEQRLRSLERAESAAEVYDVHPNSRQPKLAAAKLPGSQQPYRAAVDAGQKIGLVCA